MKTGLLAVGILAVFAAWQIAPMRVVESKGEAAAAATSKSTPSVVSKITPEPGDLTEVEYDRLDEKAFAICSSEGYQQTNVEEVAGARQVIVTCGVPKKTFLLRP